MSKHRFIIKDTVRGFTLVEALVAISIIAITVAGPLYSAGRAIVAAETARDQLTASYLAQEGAEYVRAMRDDEYLNYYNLLGGGSTVSTYAWSNFLTGTDVASITSCEAQTCTLDPTQPMGTGSSLQPCSVSNNTCAPLYPNSFGVYSLTTIPGYTGTLFTRTVRATAVSATEERIDSVVTWKFHNVPYTVTITDHLTPWE